MTEKNIYQRILAVMESVNYIQKSDKKVNNQYSFASHDEVSRVLHPELVKHGIVVIPSIASWKQDGNRTEVDVDVAFVNADKPEDRFVVRALGFGVDPQDKGPGKAVSYATKYAMLKTFVLETGDDPERDNINHEGANVIAATNRARKALEDGDWITLCEMDRAGDETWMAAWSAMGSKERAAIKKLQSVRDDYRDRMNGLANAGDRDGFSELSSELSDDEARHLYKVISAEAKVILTDMRKKAA